MKQFTHISIQQVHYSGSVENTVAFYDEAARQLAIANAAPQLVEALQSIRVFAQDCIETGHDRGALGNLYAIRDLCDAFIKAAGVEP